MGGSVSLTTMLMCVSLCEFENEVCTGNVKSVHHSNTSAWNTYVHIHEQNERVCERACVRVCVENLNKKASLAYGTCYK